MEFAYGSVDSETVEVGNGWNVLETLFLIVVFFPYPNSFINIVDDGGSVIAVGGYWCIGDPQLALAGEHVDEAEVGLVLDTFGYELGPLLTFGVHLEDMSLTK